LNKLGEKMWGGGRTSVRVRKGGFSLLLQGRDLQKKETLWTRSEGRHGILA